MSAFETAGYSPEECNILNAVRLHQQVLFESDIYNADGKTINTRYLQSREPGQQWSTYRFGKQYPLPSGFALWREAILHIAPGGRRAHQLGKFIRRSHVIWQWRYDPILDTAYHLKPTGTVPYRRSTTGRSTRQASYSSQEGPTPDTSNLPLCSVSQLTGGRISVQSHTTGAPPTRTHTHFTEVLKSWPHAQLWSNLKYTGDGSWIYHAIQAGTLICVSDGSFVRELHPQVCSAAIIIESATKGDRLSLSFTNSTRTANAFRGELLGLLAVHLLLHSLSETAPQLSGQVSIYSDCLGALHTIRSLPPAGIPSTWKHADILRIISECRKHIPLHLTYFYVKAHQDDEIDWKTLERPAQLNCACDAEAKRRIIEYHTEQPESQYLPQESISLTANGKKMTSETDSALRFYMHTREARSLFLSQGILNGAQFDEVHWEAVHTALHSSPKMFQLFAAKHVFGVSAVLGNLSKQKEFAHLGAKCPSCTTHKETTSHLLQCREEGRMKCLTRLINRLGKWLYSVGTVPSLVEVIKAFLHTRGTMQFSTHLADIPPEYARFINSQAIIGWDRTLEGMISTELTELDRGDILLPYQHTSIDLWTQRLVMKLLEVTHGIWIYRNITMHDATSGMIATKGKEQLLQEIETQIERGGEGLEERDQWMLEVPLGNIEDSTGEEESYWLLAIRTAREKFCMAHE